MATARTLSERSQKEHGFLQKSTLSMFGGEGEEFVPSLNGRRKHSYPGSPLCGLLLKYLIRQHHLSTVYLHIPARQPAHICWIRSLTSCWFGSIHSKCQSLKWGDWGKSTAEGRWNAASLLARNCQRGSRSPVDLRLPAHQRCEVYSELVWTIIPCGLAKI